MTNPQFSVVVPVYNSEKSLQELYQRLDSAFNKMNKSFEVIFVEDGASDKSWDVISGLKKEHAEKIIAIKLAKNFGQHNALLCGLKFAKGNYCVTIDDDLQQNPEDIEILYNKIIETNVDVVYGIYEENMHSLSHRIGSWYMKQSSRFSRKIIAGASFRIIKSDIAIKMLEGNHDFVYIDEILSWHTENAAFAIVHHLARKYDKSNYTNKKLISHAYNITLFYTAFPLRLMTYGGFFFSLLMLLTGLFYLLKKFFFRVPMGYTSLIVAILFSAGIMLMCMGILGEYLFRIYKSQTHKPPYSISKIL
ncbi:MAG: glycosyltransferase family 2 protein [Bacteroidales bacterium]|jgi:glycosyltransferase involved in cell wall biosynthesis